MDAYIRIDDKDYCWNHLLHYAKNENKDMKKAWKTLYSIESDKFCNFVKNNLEINK
jgi:hypothetical protein